MSVADRLFGLAKRSLLISERVERLSNVVDELAKEMREQDRRLVRVETVIDIGLRRSGPPRLTDG
jgi:hypothetical protein